MTDLAPDIVELVPCPERAVPGGRLREVAYRADVWTPDEIATLERLFSDDMAIDAIAETIGRGIHGARDKIATLGLRRNSHRAWSEDEDAWLTREYGTRPASALAQDLGRACTAVYARAGVLGLTEGNSPRWTDWEDAQLRAGFDRAIPVAQIAALVGRPLSGTITRASNLGLRHPNNPPGWTEAEAARALTLTSEGHRYLAIIETMVAEGFPRRTKAGFGPRLRKLGYGRGWGRQWTPDEDALLSRVYAEGQSRTPLIERLGRTTSSINWRVEHLGLRGTHANRDGFRGGPVWTETDIATLREHYGKMPMLELAAMMGRTKASLFTRANILGLVHGYHRPWTDDERRAVALAHAHGVALPDLVAALCRNYAGVHKFAEKQGFAFARRTRWKPTPTLQDILALAAP
jgi:hypothetical protein